MKHEPVLIILNGLAAVLSLGLAAGNVVGMFDLTAGQIAAIVAFVAGVTNLVGLAIRAAVVSPATAELAVLDAWAATPPAELTRP